MCARFQECRTDDGDARRAIGRLVSFDEADQGLLETVALGRRAIPPLREILFGREPSGLFEARCRVVEALSRLGADDVLIEFLDTPRAIDDPIERTGEDAVINAAARALARTPGPAGLAVLLRLAHGPPRGGVVAALAGRRRLDALPYYVKALEEDITRKEAEEAIRMLGPAARPALLYAAAVPSDALESESGKRRRRSALGLYADFGRGADRDQAELLRLIKDDDPEVSVTACNIWLGMGARPDTAVSRLVELLGGGGWVLDARIEDCLLKHAALAEAIVGDTLKAYAGALDIASPQVQRKTDALLRLLHRLGERLGRMAGS